MKASGETKLLLIMGAFVLIGGGVLVGLNMASAPGAKLPFTAQPTPSPTPITWTSEKFDQIVKNARYMSGDAKAPVTIVEFADFECPPCRRSYNDVISKWEKEKRPVRLVFRHFPWSFHPQALPAARAAEAAGKQGKFWPMYDALFDGVETQLSDEYITSCAKKVGLDMTRFEKDRTNPATTALVESDEALGKGLGINSTPTFVMRDAAGKIQSVDSGAKIAALLDGKPLPETPGAPGNAPGAPPTTATTP